MITVTMYIKDKIRTADIPESWRELTRKQFLSVMKILCSGVTEFQGKLDAIAELMIGRRELRYADPQVVVEYMVPLFEWILSPPDVVKQLLPNKAGWYGPASSFANLRVSEFDSAEKELWDWRQTQDDAYLYRFVAVLYRKVRLFARKWNPFIHIDDEEGDRRPAFDPTVINRNAKKLTRIFSLTEAMAIMAWYQACKRELFAAFPDLPAGSSSDERPEYFQVMRMISKEGTYGNFDQVEHMYIYNVLLELECSHKESEQLRQNSKP